MMSFLKNFLSNEKTVEEQALQQQQQHDILKLDAYMAEGEDEACDSDAPKFGGCCGGGCRQ